MNDNKFGRLFTEADVLDLLAALVPESEAQRRLAEFEGRFPADEPVFLLRAQDVYAPWGAQEYVDGLDEGRSRPPSWPERTDGLVSEGQFQGAHEAWQAMLLWQRANPDRVKVPD